MKISNQIYEQMKGDIQQVVEKMKIKIADGRPEFLGLMWELLRCVSRNRAYDGHHPNFAKGIWPRLLPYDGRDYCWYYAGGCNDSHVATALKRIKKELSQPK